MPAPFQNFLRPVHPHVVMHEAGFHHLRLRGIRQRIMRLRVFQLAFTVDFARIGGVFGQALVLPSRVFFGRGARQPKLYQDQPDPAQRAIRHRQKELSSISADFFERAGERCLLEILISD